MRKGSEIMDTKSLLKELTNLWGVSGHEDEVIKYMYKMFMNYSKDVEADALGNVICSFKSGFKDAKKLLIFGHMDEIGFVIRKVENNGFLRFERVGGVNRQILPGTILSIRGKNGEKVRGVIGVKSHHFMNADEKSRIPDVHSLYIDAGCSSKEEVYKRGIYEGCFAAFAPEFVELNKDVITVKSVDDRAACVILAGLAEKISNISEELKVDLYLVASVQEEFNIRGIMPAVQRIHPDAAIGIDITPSCDTPDLSSESDTVLGKGPAITYMNFHGRGTLAGLLPDPGLVEYIEETAVEKKIPFQREVSIGVLTETAYIQLTDNGVSTANISIPIRYSHTPIETVDIGDIENTEKLLFEVIKGFEGIKKLGRNYFVNI